MSIFAYYFLQIFSRILKSFQLPVGPSQLRVGQRKQYLDPNHSATWIIGMLVGGRDGGGRLLLKLRFISQE